jgi:molybdopterin-containing oxidoreductase family iron-sulfur binding subunit
MIELPVLPTIPSADGAPRSRFWRSVQQLEGDPAYRAFTGSELLPDASGPPPETSRRQFLQVMGASMALAGLTACRKPVEAIMPFARKPEDLVPGVPMHYATGMEFRGTLRPLVVESTDGRPTKVEGNPEHPESGGSSGVFEQASLLALYDPDRSRTVLRDGNDSDWNAFVRFASERHAGRSSGRLAVVTRPSSSMTRAAIRREMEAAWPGLRWVEYQAVPDAAARAWGLGLGTAVRPRFHFDRARVILSLDGDFLGTTDVDHLHNTRGFARSRAVDETGDMSRLYVAESAYTLTGGAADHRLAVRRSDLPALAAAVARRLGVAAGGDGSAWDNEPWVEAVAEDLRSAGPRALVVAGDDDEVQLLAVAMNRALGAIGGTVEVLDTGMPAGGEAEALEALVADMAAGRIDTLLALDANPVYDLPAALGFAQALGQVAETVHAGLYVDETARACRWHLPLAHYLEAWSDGRSAGGTRSVVQPLIAPLYEAARSDIEILGVFASGLDRGGYDLVRSTWQPLLGAGFDAAWRRVVHDGFQPDSAYGTVQPSEAVEAAIAAAAAGGAFDEGPQDGLEIVFHADSKVFDGSFANIAWLQELPDSISKVVWDNVALVSPATAASLGLRVDLVNGKHRVDRVSISTPDGTVDLPLWIAPGLAQSSVHVSLGYGRDITSSRPTRPGHVFDLDHRTDIYGQGAISTGVGVSVAPIRPGNLGMVVREGVTVTRSGGDYLVASTQDHGALPEEGAEAMNRGLYRIATLEEYRANPDFVADSEPKPIREDWSDYPSLWQNAHPADQPASKDNPYSANQWGMVIDLNACTGCNACLVACQAENNIQVVGKDQVSRGREMHWIRLDRYFVGDGADGSPRMAVQPVPCMHCENAPCESVCPVAATVHSPDGTNQMVYNRCIGTRYCANNCPYKVRRFNYYNWTKTLPDSLHMAQNPNVTVRSRGVMEKCSYCIQRVREANRRSSVENRPMRDGDVVTACQQACPAGAIVFGDLADPESRVSSARKNPRRYELLAELSVKPRTSYLGRIRNPNPRLEREA